MLKELLENENKYYKDLCRQQENEIERLNNIIKEIKKTIKWSYEEHEFQGAIHSIEELIKRK